MTVEQVDVLVVGGGTSGAAAAWQAATMGASVVVAEETPWLGGMITSAGVSALDGNKGEMASGFLLKLRTALEDHYGGPDAVRTGWVSDTCFEPHVAARLLAQWVGAAGARVWHGARLLEVLREGQRVLGARFSVGDGEREVRARTTIEATEYGDVLALAGVPFRLGRDARSETGEPHAPEHRDDRIQDLTYVAILDHFDGEAPAVPCPEGFDLSVFDCSTGVQCARPKPDWLGHRLHTWGGFIGYGGLPQDKFMLNWPFRSNDHPAPRALYEDLDRRAEILASAKRRTLAYVHYMQTALGHPEWGLARDEFGTEDGLPFLPYIRESRRVVGETLVREQDVTPLPGTKKALRHPEAIAIGDYFLDHHHAEAHLPPEARLREDYPPTAPFQIPYRALVPKDWGGLLCAEKCISVTHVANGCTRLQPVALQIGQAAGAAAALASRDEGEARDLAPEALQEVLRDAGCRLEPPG